MKFNMYKEYLNERYVPNLDLNWDQYLKETKLSCLETEHGFVTYQFDGDDLIIYDMYIKPESRSSKNAWFLHNELVKEAKLQNKRVAITFSDFIGKNHILGLRAIKAAGFKPAFKTNDQFVFIKGI